jgi:hypothetical protein
MLKDLNLQLVALVHMLRVIEQLQMVFGDMLKDKQQQQVVQHLMLRVVLHWHQILMHMQRVSIQRLVDKVLMQRGNLQQLLILGLMLKV